MQSRISTAFVAFRRFCVFIATVLALSGARGQDIDVQKIAITPHGRLLFDGALYGGNGHRLLYDGVALTDVRLGVEARYGKWDAWIDVDFAYGKVRFKDIYLGYTFDQNNFLYLGNMIHHYGPQAPLSSSLKCTMEEPSSSETFTYPRQLGLMYVLSMPKYLGTASLHAETKASLLSPNDTYHQGFGVLSRQVWRPRTEDGNILQVGISVGYSTPHYDDDAPDAGHAISIQGNFPTKVNRVTAVDVRVADARNLVKFTPEVIVSRGPAALEAQYFYTRINRREGMPAFTGQGAYGLLRLLLKGGNYSYAMNTGILRLPKPGSLECALCYSYTTLSDSKSGYLGGRLSDVSCTVNYYFNKYVIARLRCGYARRWDKAGAPDINLCTVQGRLQITF